MKYLIKDNLIALSYERFIDESSKDNDDTLDDCEAQNIELIKSYIGTRYDIDKLFDEIQPIKNEIIIRVLSKLVLFDIIRRNAARKVPSGTKEEYDKAIELLEKIATGRIKLDGVPTPTDNNGNPISNSIWGNNTNTDFYI